ncbi:MAG: PadR family transcriptional regulator [Dehalococcoidales bacterium]|nr:PadR family transcriptional regulator [Dehalococcoidales bacterium]
MANIRLVILGILGRYPMHGYEIKHIIEDHMGDWTDIKFGSIYFALSKLAEDGAIEVDKETREGNRPSRIVYRITEKGRHEFLRLLRELWSGEDDTLYAFDIGVFFMRSLPLPEAEKLLDERIDKTKRKLVYLEHHRSEYEGNPHIPLQAMAIMQHSLLHLQAELSWLKDLKKNLGRYY